MDLILLSFFAGILTILAPCVLPLLPVILWASSSESEDKARPYIIIAALWISVIVFSLLLKTTTHFIWAPETYLKIASGAIILFFGLITLFPNVWKKMSGKFSGSANQNLAKSANKKWVKGSILVWMSLGPVFSSCSPTYGIILGIILPASFAVWMLNLVAYVLGLSVIMLAITLLGQKFISKLKWASDPDGLFKKILWVLFLVIGLAIIFGWDKTFESYVISNWYLGASELEQQFLDKIEIPQ